MTADEKSQPAITLIGNPGTGKSTILNGLVRSSKFSSGLAFGSGRTTALQEYECDGVTYFDTPGLNDVDRRKEAGAEIDKLLRRNVGLRIVFIVFALNGRILPEDATTIRLVLDAITSVDTNDRFGVVINQAPPKWIKALQTSPIRERRVRSSYTGDRYTSHWHYVEYDDKLASAEDAQLMTPELRQFLDGLPETKPLGASVVDVDTNSFEEKLLQERDAFEKKEEVLRMELAAQNNRMKTIEALAEQLSNTLSQEREVNKEKQEEMVKQQKVLEGRIEEQVKSILSANEEAKKLKTSLSDMQVTAERNEQKAQEDFDKMRKEMGKELESVKAQNQEYIDALSDEDRRNMWVATLEMISNVAPLVGVALALL